MIAILIILFLILLNGVFAMAEIAMVSSRKSRLEFEAKRGNKAAKKALELSNNPGKFLSTVQIGITLIGILTGIYSGEKIEDDLESYLMRFELLMIPLMSVAAVSFAIVKYFEPFSLDAKAIAEAGHLQRHRDTTILSSMEVSDIVETDFQPLSPDDTLEQLVAVVSRSGRNIFPVVDDNNHLAGIIRLDKIRNVLFKTEMYDTVLVKELMVLPPAVISVREDMTTVMKKFDETSAWNLPVTEDNVYKGFISKSSLLSAYRNHLIKTSVET